MSLAFSLAWRFLLCVCVATSSFSNLLLQYQWKLPLLNFYLLELTEDTIHFLRCYVWATVCIRGKQKEVQRCKIQRCRSVWCCCCRATRTTGDKTATTALYRGRVCSCNVEPEMMLKVQVTMQSCNTVVLLKSFMVVKHQKFYSHSVGFYSWIKLCVNAWTNGQGMNIKMSSFIFQARI